MLSKCVDVTVKAERERDITQNDKQDQGVADYHLELERGLFI